MKLSAHFDSSEFRCRCILCRNVEALVADELVQGLEELRSLLNADLAEGKPEHILVINSGARCFSHNSSKAVGGKKSSQHLYNPIIGRQCRAADVYSPTRSTRAVYEAALTIPAFKGVGLAPPSLDWITTDGVKGHRGYVHVDVRDTVARAQWGYDDRGKTVALASVLPRLALEHGERV